ncbi:MAG: glycoside hydrolase family 3 protein, partial [Clostridiales bacterium]|nr:glycoside hydrolase family 3 protein [Clostridiales bacterium]
MPVRLKDAESIEAIISEMTLEEKAALVIGASPFRTKPLEKYGIPALVVMDGGTGYNSIQAEKEHAFRAYCKRRISAGIPVSEDEFPEGDECLDTNKLSLLAGGAVQAPDLGEMIAARPVLPLGCYPPGMFLGATWNPEIIERCGKALGREANACGIDILLGTPNVNIHRDPLGGRIFEGYSEDPCLVSNLAPAFVKGIMEGGVVANVKHFAANNQEKGRRGINEHIEEETLREIYFPGFKACVEAGCATVMAAYNSINGSACAMNKWLLTDVLRGEWGFEGFVMSDWGGAYDEAEAIAAGCDLIMPGPRTTAPLVTAVREGVLPESKLDDAIRRYLKVLLKTPAVKGHLTFEDIDPEEGKRAAYDAACEGITLLKNDGVLPLSEGSKVAFYGRHSREMIASGEGSAEVITSLNTNVYDCAAKITDVTFGEACEDTDVIVVTVSAQGQEFFDRESMAMPEEDRIALEEATAESKSLGVPLVVLMNISGPIDIVDWESDASAIVCEFFPGMQGGAAMADILFGRVNPSGKLPLTFPKSYDVTPTKDNFGGDGIELTYAEGINIGY